MIITLNLISPEQRRRLRRCLVVDELRSLANTVIFITLLISAWLLAAKYLLQSTADLFQSNTKPINEAISLKVEDITIIKLINSTLNQTTSWSDWLPNLAKLTPAGITLKTIDINDSGDIQISGQAQKRDQLLQFQNSLNNSGLMNNLYSPVKNLLQAQNINFDLTAELPNHVEAKKK